MKTLYIDCGMGAAGDMLTAALLELLPDRDGLIRQLNAIGLPGVEISQETAVKCGITGTHVSVKIHGVEEELSGSHNSHAKEGQHDHARSLHDIQQLVQDFHNVDDRVKEDVIAVYGLIAQAESQVHGVPVTEIHFHEIGAMDAILDILAVCLLMSALDPDEVVVSPIHVGSGQVRCAHGLLPVPAPATAYLLKDVPIYGGRIQGELCTPTGAALLKHFAHRFGDLPVMKIKAIGYGMGKKDFEAANCVRAMLGEAEDKTDTVLELSCNVDDMTAEQIGFAMEWLMEEGALDVYTIPIGMKKSRPGTLIRVMCPEGEREKMIALIFQHTTTIGVRETKLLRYVLNRSIETVHTPYGCVRRKDARGYGVARSKFEYEDLAAIARKKKISIAQALGLVDEYQ